MPSVVLCNRHIDEPQGFLGLMLSPKSDNQNLIYKVGWLFEKNIEPLLIFLHPTTDIVLMRHERLRDENIQIN